MLIPFLTFQTIYSPESKHAGTQLMGLSAIMLSLCLLWGLKSILNFPQPVFSLHILYSGILFSNSLCFLGYFLTLLIISIMELLELKLKLCIWYGVALCIMVCLWFYCFTCLLLSLQTFLDLLFIFRLIKKSYFLKPFVLFI